MVSWNPKIHCFFVSVIKKNTPTWGLTEIRSINQGRGTYLQLQLQHLWGPPTFTLNIQRRVAASGLYLGSAKKKTKASNLGKRVFFFWSRLTKRFERFEGKRRKPQDGLCWLSVWVQSPFMIGWLRCIITSSTRSLGCMKPFSGNKLDPLGYMLHAWNIDLHEFMVNVW